jgi:hypothetical protein
MAIDLALSAVNRTFLMPSVQPLAPVAASYSWIWPVLVASSVTVPT